MDTMSYLMGVFDGEGSINSYYQRGNWTLTCSVTMAAHDIVALFQKTWGGGIYIRKKPTAGGLILHQWYLSASKAIPFLEYAAENALYRRDRAKIALELARSMAKYSAKGGRMGANVSLGHKVISEEDRANRNRLVLELRRTAGARSRFDPDYQPPEPGEQAAPPAIMRPTREQLIHLYLEQELSASEVAASLGCSAAVVRGTMHYYGIPFRNRSDAARIKRARRKQAAQSPIGSSSYITT